MSERKVWNGILISVGATLLSSGALAMVSKFGNFVSDKVEADIPEISSPYEDKDSSIFEDTCKHVRVVQEGYSATCEEDGLTDGVVCAICGDILEKQNIIPSLGHSWIEKEILTQATCTTYGTALYDCTICKTTKTEGLPAFGHTEALLPALDPTCTMEGWTEGIQCSTCNAYIVEPQRIDKLPHVDEDGNGICESCAMVVDAYAYLALFSNTENYTQTVATSGDKVAGQVIRIMRNPESVSTAYLGQGYFLAFSSAINGSITGIQAPPKNVPEEYSDCVVFKPGSNPYKLLSGLVYIIYDDYVDFYIPEGEIISSVGTLIVDENTTIDGGWLGPGISYILILNSD